MLTSHQAFTLLAIKRSGFRTNGTGQVCLPFRALPRDGRSRRSETRLVRMGLAREIGGCVMLTPEGIARCAEIEE